MSCMSGWLVIACLLAQIACADTIFVTDIFPVTPKSIGSVHRFDMEGNRLSTRATTGAMEITRDSKGNVYVDVPQAILKFSSAGKLLQTLKAKNSNFSNSFGPMACTPSGELYSYNSFSGYVERFSSAGAYIVQPQPLGLGNVFAMASDRAGNLYVAGIGGINRYSTTTGQYTVFASEIYMAGALACDDDNNVYVAVPGGAVRKYTPAGQLVGNFITPGYGVGAMAFDSLGRLWLLNTNNFSLMGYSRSGVWVKTLQIQNSGLVQGYHFTIVRGYNEAAGVFTGLGASEDSSVSLTLTTTGSFTGSVSFAGRSAVSVKGVLDQHGYFSGTFGKPAFTLSVQLDAAGGGDAIAAQINGEPCAMAGALYQKGVVLPEAGKYTVLLESPHSTLPGHPGSGDYTGPDGLGYGTLAVSSTGVSSLTVRLGDGTSITRSAPLVSDGGLPRSDWFHPGIYRSVGRLVGAMSFEELSFTDASADLKWAKPVVAGVLPSNFDTELGMKVCRYTAPKAPQTAAPLTAFGMLLHGGDLSDDLSLAGALSSVGKVSLTAPAGLKPTLTITASSGAISGSFIHPLTQKSVKLSGVLLQRGSSTIAGGHFIGPKIGGFVKTGGWGLKW